jgi:hypothetical protein
MTDANNRNKLHLLYNEQRTECGRPVGSLYVTNNWDEWEDVIDSGIDYCKSCDNAMTPNYKE